MMFKTSHVLPYNFVQGCQHQIEGITIYLVGETLLPISSSMLMSLLHYISFIVF